MPDPPPIDYRSPTTGPPGRVPMEALEEAYGCFPAALALVLAAAGVAVMAFARSARHGWAIGLAGAVAVAVNFIAWRSALSAVRSPRGFWFGVTAAIGVAVFTALTGLAALFGRR